MMGIETDVFPRSGPGQQFVEGAGRYDAEGQSGFETICVKHNLGLHINNSAVTYEVKNDFCPTSQAQQICLKFLCEV